VNFPVKSRTGTIEVNGWYGTKLNNLSFFVKYMYKCQIWGGYDIIISNNNY